MNTGNNFRDATSSSRIVSQYFSNNLVMDESSKAIIKDKQSNTKKPQAKTNKLQKRRKKKVAGQKDIRTLVKAKKNELLKYTEDFDLICKQSGIDVDPEKLQLAIALSKSLHDNKSANNDGSNAEKPLTSNQRRSKIRTTLQEYGFQTKKAPSKKVKRYRKQYKLILVSDTEKQQRIADKFAEILISNVFISKGYVESLPKNINIDANLYNLTTNVEYNDIRDDEIFHVIDLVPKTVHKYCVSSKFKDWSKIPGRPVSPKLEEVKHSFKDIECSQKELDRILSSPIELAQNIVKQNYTNNCLKPITSENTSFTKVEINQESSSEFKSKSTLVGIFCENKSIKDSRTLDISFNNTQTMALPINRSCSPDLFDDEVTIIMDSPKDKISEPEGISERTITVKENDFMDLTNCIGNMNANYIDSKHIPCFSQGSNKTRSKSNDFMDLTECIPACSQKISHTVQSIGKLEKPNKNCEVIHKDGHDINQTSNFSYNYKPNSGSNDNSLDDTIIMIDEDYNNIKHSNKSNISKSASEQSVIIDLVGAQNESPRMLKIMPKSYDSIVDLEENPEFCDNSYPQKYCQYNGPENGSLTIIPNSTKNKEYVSTVDLTQPSNFKDCLSVVKVHSVMSMNTWEIPTELNNISTNAVFPGGDDDHNRIENSIEIEKDVRLEKFDDVEGIDLTQCSNSEESLQEVLSEPSANKVQNANESSEENGESSEKCKNFESLDLTQSSDSEDCLEEMNEHKPSINNRSLDDTIVLNNEHCNSIVVTNELGGNDDLNCLDLYNDEQHKHYIDSIDAQRTPNAKINTRNNVLTTFDMDNDLEFDNLVKNVSNSKPSISHTSYLYDKKDSSSSLNLLDNYTDENKPNYEELDLTQNYNCSPDKLSEAKSLSGKSSNMDDDDDHRKCNVIKDDPYEMEIDSEKVVKSACYWDEDLEMPEVVTKISETNDNQRKFDVDDDSNSEIDNVRQELSNNIQLIYDDNHDSQNCDIDLTQQSDCSDDTSCSPKIIEVPEELGKRNNISIDYDEICGDTSLTKDCEITTPLCSNKYKENDKNGSKDEGASGLSQQSEVFELSDNEFNYSIHQHMQDNESLKLKPNNFDIGGISVIDDFLNRKSLATRNNLRCSCSSNSESNTNDKTLESCLPVVGTENMLGNNIGKESKSCEEVKIVKVTTPLKARSENNILIAKTPKNDDYIIKTDQVTPMPNYENMTSPERNEELDKFGVKPLKRKRAIQILTHIYNQTHPIMEVISTDEYASPSKITRKNNVESFPRRVVATQFDTVEELSSQTSQTIQHKSKDRRKLAKDSQKSPKKGSSNESILYEETTLKPVIRNIECFSEDWVFQKREKAKVHSCRVPLHIAFHNYVSSRKALREAILRYEPINIDDIHKGLVAVGYRYNPKDLLKFMDRKCITVKTADNSKKNKDS